MAELNVSSGKPGVRRSTGKMPVRVDLTAMVDLAFLLITFFMLTTSLSKPREMPLAMPSPGPSEAVSENSTITICLGKNNQALWYMGMAEKPLIQPSLTTYGKQMRTFLIETQKKLKAETGKNLMVVIKPDDHSNYENLVATLDELNITKVPSYAIAKIDAKDIALLKAKGIY